MPSPEEEHVEAIFHFFITIGEQLDESPKSQRVKDIYFSRLKELAKNQQLAARLRFMFPNVIDLRDSKWVPRREEVSPINFSCFVEPSSKFRVIFLKEAKRNCNQLNEILTDPFMALEATNL